MDELSAEQARIDAINRKAWEIRANDPKRCGLLSEEAMELARSIDYRKGIAEGMRGFSVSLILHSRFEQAVDLMDQAMHIFQETGDECGQSDLHEYYGSIAGSRGDYTSSLEHLYNSLQLRKANHYTEGEALSLYQLGVTYRNLGNQEKALDFFLQSLELCNKKNVRIEGTNSMNHIGNIYLELEKPDEALSFFQQSRDFCESSGDEWGVAGCLNNIGRSYFMLKNFEKARENYFNGNAISTSVNDIHGEGNTFLHLAEVELELSNRELAFDYASRCLSIRTGTGDKKGQAEALLLLSDLNQDKKKLPLLEKALELANSIGSFDLSGKVHWKFYDYFKSLRAYDKALEHLERYVKAEKEFHSSVFTEKVANLHIAYQVEQNLNESEIYRLKHIELAGQMEESEKQKQALNDATENLYATRLQRSKHEKLASLGELTAGFAHEIQNPLNFVNNFSESGSEILDEMKTEMLKGNQAEALKILLDLKNNLKKINFHGQRADTMVKLMLQLSQPDTGEKELTDINNLVDEYLRLAYHGMRAKDKSFTAELELNYEPSLRPIPVIPQDIGFVVFNILNNALYAVKEKRKNAGTDYVPKITVSTILHKPSDTGHGQPKMIRIRIDDNGVGTGSGLALSYDIIKANGGDISVETSPGGMPGKEDGGTVICIDLPV